MPALPMTDDQRAHVHPFRGDAVTLPAAELGLERLQRWWNAPPAHENDPGRRVRWVRGLEHAAEPVASACRGAIEILDAPSPAASDVEAEAAALWMLDQWSRRDLVMPGAYVSANERYAPIDALFVRRWLAGGGIPFALQVLAAFPRYEADFTHVEQNVAAIKQRDGAAWWCLEQGHLGLVHALRKAIVASDAGEYARGVAEAKRMQEAAPAFVRAALAFAFPDEPFGEAVLRDAQPKSKKGRLGTGAWGLATTKIDVAHLPAILDSMARDSDPWVSYTERYGFTLVHRLGDAAAPYLAAYLEAVRAKSAKEMFAEALARTDSAEARTFFEAKKKDKTLGPLAKRYLAA